MWIVEKIKNLIQRVKSWDNVETPVDVVEPVKIRKTRVKKETTVKKRGRPKKVV